MEAYVNPVNSVLQSFELPNRNRGTTDSIISIVGRIYASR